MAPVPKAFVVGHPIRHSRSPLIHGAWLSRHGIAGAYERIDVAPDSFDAFLRGFGDQGFVGGNVTVPHKEAAFRGADEATATARRLGAANTLWREGGRLMADNTDAYGFAAHLGQTLGEGWAQETGAALVLGAGGAARAVVAALLDGGVETVAVANRTILRAESLRSLAPGRVKPVAWAEAETRLPEVQLLVNTTSLGMDGQPPLRLDLAGLPAHAAVADIVYVPLETPLLAAARGRDLRAVDGLGMLLHQAVPGFARWFGVTPEVTPALRALVVADLDEARRR